jgi:membrane protein YdbS with pleckstrin-like domain
MSDLDSEPADGGPAAEGGAADSVDVATTVDHTTDRRTISARIRVIWGLRVLAGIAVLSAAVTVGASRVALVPFWTGPVLGVLLILIGLVWIEARYRIWAYEVRADALYLERGVLRHVRTIAPFVRIQHVDTRRGPLERWLGLSTLVVYTAGSRGADVSIPGLQPSVASDLQSRVKELAIAAEGGDAV